MLLQLLHHYLDGLFELRIVPCAPCGGFKVNFNVRRDAVVFHFPLTVQAVDGRTRRGDAPAVNQFRITADPDQSAPGFLATEWPDAGLAEIPRQRISTVAGHLV